MTGTCQAFLLQVFNIYVHVLSKNKGLITNHPFVVFGALATTMIMQSSKCELMY